MFLILISCNNSILPEKFCFTDKPSEHPRTAGVCSGKAVHEVGREMRDIFGCVLKIEAVLDCTLATGLLARYILPETPKTRLGDFEGVDVEKDGASDGFVSKEVPGAAELPQRSGGKRNGNNHSTDPWKRCHNRRPLQVAWVALRKGLRTVPPP